MSGCTIESDPGSPHCGDNWTEIKGTWETEKNKQMSEQNKKIRASSSSEWSATYAGGSINIKKRRKRMADELGMEPTYTAPFKRTFQKKDKTWTGDRVKAIKVAATSSSNAVVKMRTQLEKQMTQKLSQVKQFLAKQDEQIRVLQQQIKLVLRHLNLDPDEVPSVPPTNPIGDGHNDERHDDDDIAADDDDFVTP